MQDSSILNWASSEEASPDWAGAVVGTAAGSAASALEPLSWTQATIKPIATSKPKINPTRGTGVSPACGCEGVRSPESITRFRLLTPKHP